MDAVWGNCYLFPVSGPARLFLLQFLETASRSQPYYKVAPDTTTPGIVVMPDNN